MAIVDPRAVTGRADAAYQPIMHLSPLKLWSSIVTYVAAMVAMYISMRLSFPRPWWVLMTVYVTTQPLAGTMRPKMTYRLAGVVAGAIVAVLLVPRLVNAPEALTLAIAAWIAFCLYFAILDRTSRAFGFMLAAYTAVIIGFPYLDQPGDIFKIALDRVEEMALGIICPIVAHTILLPWNPAKTLKRRTDAFLADGSRWFAEALRGVHGFQADNERRRFAGDMVELTNMAVHLPSDALTSVVSRRFVGALQDELVVLLPLASAAQDRLDALRKLGRLPREIGELVDAVIGWLRHADATPSEGRALAARCAGLAPKLDGNAGWPSLLAASLCQRLADFLEAYANSLELTQHMVSPSAAPSHHLDRLLQRQRHRALHRHHPMALLSAAGAAAALIGYCAVWVLTGWPEGAATAAFAAMISCSFSSQDDPAPAILKYLGFTIAALPLSAFYLFGLLPAIDGVAELAVSLAPALLFMGYIQADPARAPYALPMLACFIVAMGFLDRFTADYARFFNVAFAQMGGVIVTIASARLFRSVGADWSLRRILRSSWREIAALAGSRRASDEVGWTYRMSDRLGLVASRMALLSAGESAEGVDALRDLRVGRNIIRLRHARAISPVVAAGPLNLLLSQTADFYTMRAAHGRALAPPHSLLTAIDDALGVLSALPAGNTRRQGFLAATGLRRNLFPEAAAYAGAPA
jgi:uncharacterized membrane protein YccC